jgi:predicted glycosyltransferase
MKILVDIIHPANVHYFKHFIFEMKSKGHVVYITARDKEVSFKLLDSYNLDYINMGKGTIGKGGFGKMLYLMYAEILMFYCLAKLKPDITLSFSSTPIAHISFLFRIPHISFDDTEHAKLNRKLYLPVTPLALSPASFYENLGKKHFKFKGYMELFYLNKKRFKPNPAILNELKVQEGDVFTIFRLVSWGAFHDIGEQGIKDDEKLKIVKEAEKYGSVFISSEGALPEELKKYELKIEPHKLHDILYFAKLYIGEGGTTASECAMLGTPSIYINSLPLMGYLQEAEKFDLLYYCKTFEHIKEKMEQVYNNNESVIYYRKKSDEMLKNCIDPTSLLVWLVENYPKSKEIILANPEYQNRFV